jgi:hypothetical protein
MADRGSIPQIPGLLTGFVTPSVIPLQVAYFASATVLNRVSFRVTDPPTGGSVTAQLNTASDVSGSSISAVILDGTRFITATGSVSIAAGGALYLRVTAESGSAMNFSGEYEVDSVSGVTSMLTSLALVKLHAKITGTDADRDTVLAAWIAGISRQMQSYMSRTIASASTTNEKIDSNGSHAIQAHDYPIITVTSLYERETLLAENVDFELNPLDRKLGQIVRISDAYPIGWLPGIRVVRLTYNHGYANVPDDLVWAATEAVVLRYYNTVQSGKGWGGLGSKGVEPAASATYDKDFWARDIVPVLDPYRRMAF